MQAIVPVEVSDDTLTSGVLSASSPATAYAKMMYTGLSGFCNTQLFPGDLRVAGLLTGRPKLLRRTLHVGFSCPPATAARLQAYAHERGGYLPLSSLHGSFEVYLQHDHRQAPREYMVSNLPDGYTDDTTLKLLKHAGLHVVGFNRDTGHVPTLEEQAVLAATPMLSGTRAVVALTGPSFPPRELPVTINGVLTTLRFQPRRARHLLPPLLLAPHVVGGPATTGSGPPANPAMVQAAQAAAAAATSACVNAGAHARVSAPHHADSVSRQQGSPASTMHRDIAESGHNGAAAGELLALQMASGAARDGSRTAVATVAHALLPSLAGRASAPSYAARVAAAASQTASDLAVSAAPRTAPCVMSQQPLGASTSQPPAVPTACMPSILDPMLTDPRCLKRPTPPSLGVNLREKKATTPCVQLPAQQSADAIMQHRAGEAAQQIAGASAQQVAGAPAQPSTGVAAPPSAAQSAIVAARSARRAARRAAKRAATGPRVPQAQQAAARKAAAEAAQSAMDEDTFNLIRTLCQHCHSGGPDRVDFEDGLSLYVSCLPATAGGDEDSMELLRDIAREAADVFDIADNASLRLYNNTSAKWAQFTNLQLQALGDNTFRLSRLRAKLLALRRDLPTNLSSATHEAGTRFVPIPPPRSLITQWPSPFAPALDAAPMDVCKPRSDMTPASQSLAQGSMCGAGLAATCIDVAVMRGACHALTRPMADLHCPPLQGALAAVAVSGKDTSTGVHLATPGSTGTAQNAAPTVLPGELHESPTHCALGLRVGVPSPEAPAMTPESWDQPTVANAAFTFATDDGPYAPDSDPDSSLEDTPAPAAPRPGALAAAPPALPGPPLDA